MADVIEAKIVADLDIQTKDLNSKLQNLKRELESALSLGSKSTAIDTAQKSVDNLLESMKRLSMTTAAHPNVDTSDVQKALQLYTQLNNMMRSFEGARGGMPKLAQDLPRLAQELSTASERASRFASATQGRADFVSRGSVRSGLIEGTGPYQATERVYVDYRGRVTKGTPPTVYPNATTAGYGYPGGSSALRHSEFEAAYPGFGGPTVVRKRPYPANVTALPLGATRIEERAYENQAFLDRALKQDQSILTVTPRGHTPSKSYLLDEAGQRLLAAEKLAALSTGKQPYILDTRTAAQMWADKFTGRGTAETLEKGARPKQSFYDATLEQMSRELGVKLTSAGGPGFAPTVIRKWQDSSEASARGTLEALEKETAWKRKLSSANQALINATSDVYRNEQRYAQVEDERRRFIRSSVDARDRGTHVASKVTSIANMGAFAVKDAAGKVIVPSWHDYTIAELRSGLAHEFVGREVFGGTAYRAPVDTGRGRRSGGLPYQFPTDYAAIGGFPVVGDIPVFDPKGRLLNTGSRLWHGSGKPGMFGEGTGLKGALTQMARGPISALVFLPGYGLVRMAGHAFSAGVTGCYRLDYIKELFQAAPILGHGGTYNLETQAQATIGPYMGMPGFDMKNFLDRYTTIAGRKTWENVPQHAVLETVKQSMLAEMYSKGGKETTELLSRFAEALTLSPRYKKDLQKRFAERPEARAEFTQEIIAQYGEAIAESAGFGPEFKNFMNQAGFSMVNQGFSKERIMTEALMSVDFGARASTVGLFQKHIATEKGREGLANLFLAARMDPLTGERLPKEMPLVLPSNRQYKDLNPNQQRFAREAGLYYRDNKGQMHYDEAMKKAWDRYNPYRRNMHHRLKEAHSEGMLYTHALRAHEEITKQGFDYELDPLFNQGDRMGTAQIKTWMLNEGAEVQAMAAERSKELMGIKPGEQRSALGQEERVRSDASLAFNRAWNVHKMFYSNLARRLNLGEAASSWSDTVEAAALRLAGQSSKKPLPSSEEKNLAWKRRLRQGPSETISRVLNWFISAYSDDESKLFGRTDSSWNSTLKSLDKYYMPWGEEGVGRPKEHLTPLGAKVEKGEQVSKAAELGEGEDTEKVASEDAGFSQMFAFFDESTLRFDNAVDKFVKLAQLSPSSQFPISFETVAGD